MSKLLLFIILSLSLNAKEIIPHIVDNKNVRLITNDKTFDSSIIKEKNYLINYVDPDERGLNEDMMDRLELHNFNAGSIAIINLEATWIPNFLLEAILEENQKKHPDTIFVKDLNKELVEFWNLEDDNVHTLVLNEKHEILFKKSGKLSLEDEKEIIKLLSN